MYAAPRFVFYDTNDNNHNYCSSDWSLSSKLPHALVVEFLSAIMSWSFYKSRMHTRRDPSNTSIDRTCTAVWVIDFLEVVYSFIYIPICLFRLVMFYLHGWNIHFLSFSYVTQCKYYFVKVNKLTPAKKIQ